MYEYLFIGGSCDGMYILLDSKRTHYTTYHREWIGITWETHVEEYIPFFIEWKGRVVKMYALKTLRVQEIVRYLND